MQLGDKPPSIQIVIDSITINSEFVKSAAKSAGISDCGIARAEALPATLFRLDQWLASGYHADMDYMQRNRDKRRDPRLLYPGARSVISLVLAYKSDRLMQGKAKIAQYAYGEDYHELMKRKMYQLMAVIKERYPAFEGRPFVDTAPISDRHWAVMAGLGWIGKNTLFCHSSLGTFCFLGEIVTAAESDNYDEPLEARDACAGCRLCLDACPNGALSFDEATHVPTLDARRCTSYNTIENRSDELPNTLDTRGYAFGCDICQLVCPYNRQAPSAITLTDDRKTELEALEKADSSIFRKASKHSAISRIKYSQWQRNLRHNSEQG